MRKLGHLVNWLFLVSLVACNGSSNPEPRLGVIQGDFGVYFDLESLSLTLERGEQVLLELGRDGLELGRVDALDDNVNYDPWPLVAGEGLADYTPPEGLRFLGIETAEPVSTSASVLELALTHERGKQSTLRIEGTAEGRFRLTWTPAASGDDVAYFRIRAGIDSSEGFYGLGGYLDQVNHRGKQRAMQLELDLSLESGYNEAHVPIPFAIGTTGWGVFVDSNYPGVFEMASERDDEVTFTFGTGAASSEGLTFHLFAADHPLDVTRHYYQVTGAPLLPARWSLGPWLWRDENDDQAQVISDVNTMRDLDLAASAVWIDRPYASGVNSFDFKPEQFPDPEAMIAQIHDLGYRLALWHTPYVDQDDPATQDLYEFAEAEGYFPPRTGLVLNNWSAPIDLTNPDAYAWWQDLIRRYTGMGIEGFKLDYAEDVVVGLLGARNKWEFADGSDERSMHARYQFLYHRVYAETLPDSGGFLICRSGTHGDQAHTSVIWPGDLDANMARHGELVTDGEEEYVAVGGLPASMIYGLSLGPSGYPFYGSDTGGYRHSPPDKETFTRWFQQTALSSVMQVGTNSNDVPWEFLPDNGFDQEMLDWYRVFARLHLRLWPYEWTLATRIAETGHPIQRPIGLMYPEMGLHPDDVYMFGEDLLVAPVVTYGAREKEVTFPPGRWVNWFKGEVHQGDAEETVPAPLDTLPLYQKEGSIVPLLRPGIDSMAPTGQPDRVDSYASSAGVLHPRVAAGEASVFVLFDGTELRQEKTSSGVNLYAHDGTEFTQGFCFEVVAFGNQKPTSVTDNASDLSERASLEALEQAGSGWFFDPALGGTVFVKVSPGEHDLTIVR